MTDPRKSLAAAQRELPIEEAQREERHQRLATLLAAFADGELPAETASQIDAHLLGCTRCRRELQVHRTLRLRLEEEPLFTASTSLRDRIIAAVAAAPAPQWESLAETVVVEKVAVEPARQPEPHRDVRRVGIIAGVALGLALAFIGVRFAVERAAAPAVSMVTSASVPLVGSALADYRRVTRGDLPGRGRDLAVVRDAVPFPVQAMQADGLRLLAAWTTSLNGEPAAVLAYRWNDSVVLQYVVSDLELYRPAEVRNAFANGRLLAAHEGDQSVVAWPEAASGSLVIADMPLSRLELLRKATSAR